MYLLMNILIPTFIYFSFKLVIITAPAHLNVSFFFTSSNFEFYLMNALVVYVDIDQGIQFIRLYSKLQLAIYIHGFSYT